MGYGYKWKPSKKKTREFVQKMDETQAYCDKNGISYSASMDSYYFEINGKKYRVSNHSIEASNRKSRNAEGQYLREKYHPDKKENDIIYIHASKTRLIEIHTNLLAGEQLDGKGN